jgi:sigma-B regulation protein RsbU (phosphoserine phosphatase)
MRRVTQSSTAVEPDDDPQAHYDRAPCGYLTTTPDGTVLKVNQTLLRWTGFTEDELVGVRTFASLLTVGGRIYHDTHYAPMLRLQNQVREIALEVLRPDGERVPVLVNAVLERDQAGEPLLVRVVLFGAAERREYERELLRAKQRAEASEARARSLAMTLQQTLIPPHPPEIPGLDVSTVYRPAGTGEEVGGDFYDVFEIGTDDWVVTLGDVCGKGVDAAIVTSLVRHTLRAVTVRLPKPVKAMRALNEVLLHHPTDRFCTVALVRLRRVHGRWEVTMSLGGHPPPLLLRHGKPLETLGSPGTLVGVVTEPVFSETHAVLAPGSTLILYTDGVTDARRAGAPPYGEERLTEFVELHRESVSIADEIVADVLEFQSGNARDDIAVVAITVPHHG